MSYYLLTKIIFILSLPLYVDSHFILSVVLPIISVISVTKHLKHSIQQKILNRYLYNTLNKIPNKAHDNLLCTDMIC